MIFEPIQNCKLEMLCFGDIRGVKVTVTLRENQKWNAKKKQKYYNLTRKGSSTTLRVSETAIGKLFKEVSE